LGAKENGSRALVIKALKVREDVNYRCADCHSSFNNSQTWYWTAVVPLPVVGVPFRTICAALITTNVLITWEGNIQGSEITGHYTVSVPPALKAQGFIDQEGVWKVSK
jgi:hypothetical protein